MTFANTFTSIYFLEGSLLNATIVFLCVKCSGFVGLSWMGHGEGGVWEAHQPCAAGEILSCFCLERAFSRS